MAAKNSTKCQPLSFHKQLDGYPNVTCAKITKHWHTFSFFFLAQNLPFSTTTTTKSHTWWQGRSVTLTPKIMYYLAKNYTTDHQASLCFSCNTLLQLTCTV